MPTILDIAQDYLDRLAVIEREATQAILSAYAGILANLRSELLATLADIRSRTQAGELIPVSVIRREERLRNLIAQAEAEVTAFARELDAILTLQQAQAAQLAQQAAQALMLAATGPNAPIALVFAQLPNEVIRTLVGHLSDGSPLARLLADLGPQAARDIRAALLEGLAAGLGPRQIARKMRDALGGNMLRAVTIARTEILRAYRETARRTYAANADVLEGWVWVAKLDIRTCAFCWAMHGSFHPRDEVMGTHPRCRCAPVPRTRSWADLGFRDIPDARPAIATGSEIFDQLPAGKQRRILGPAKFAAYRDGVIDLADLIGQGHHPRWGPVGWERSLRDILGRQAADEWLQAAD